MRQVGWAAGLLTGRLAAGFGLFAILAIVNGTATPAVACPGDNGCDNPVKVLLENQQAAEEAAAEADIGAPLSIQSKKTVRSKTQPARQTTAKKKSQPVPDREATHTAIQNAPQAVKDANAEAREADLARQAAKAIPIVGADEVNEIDARAAAPEFPQDIPTQTAATQPVVPEPPPAAAAIDADVPRLAMARVESSAAEQAESTPSSDSAWGSTSTIGKIFIALGGFLTAASAIRMFIG